MTAKRLRSGVEASVYVFVPVDRAKTLGKVHTFVDHNSKRYVDTGFELKNPDQQNTEFDRVQLLDRPVDEPADNGVERIPRSADRNECFVKKLLVHTLVGRLVMKLIEQLVHTMSGDLLLVQGLQQQLTSARPSAC